MRPTPSEKRRIGILAGWGRYPVVIAEVLRRQGCEVYCLGVIGHADPGLAEVCHEFRYLGLAKFGTCIRYFRRRGIKEVTMAGKIFKTRLFHRWAWLRHLPDLRTIRMFVPHFWTRKRDCRDDSLLLAIVNEFAAEGIRFAPATDYAPDLLVGPGRLTRRGPNAWQQKDIEFGWKMAKEMGRLDVGQSVAVKDQATLAIEAIEGTDECIRRAGGLCRAGGFTVVKVAKPQQDMRFDVPTVGLGTLETLHAAGGKVLAVEAHRTILLDREAVIDYADRVGLVVVAVAGPADGATASPA
jgi:hypothetical protein